MANADGILATIPQFVALMHGNRSILEDDKSTRINTQRTAVGDVLSAVKLLKPPRSNPHEGDSVHVAVLILDRTSWIDEEIIWTVKDGLAPRVAEEKILGYDSAWSPAKGKRQEQRQQEWEK